MRLSDLSPRWCAAYDAPADAKQGISFLCPHCRACRLAVFFTPTICGNPPVDIKMIHRQQSDPGHMNEEHVGRILWSRISGETFEDLTLMPSVDASAWGCWHGHISSGSMV